MCVARGGILSHKLKSQLFNSKCNNSYWPIRLYIGLKEAEKRLYNGCLATHMTVVWCFQQVEVYLPKSGPTTDTMQAHGRSGMGQLRSMEEWADQTGSRDICTSHGTYHLGRKAHHLLFYCDLSTTFMPPSSWYLWLIRTPYSSTDRGAGNRGRVSSLIKNPCVSCSLPNTGSGRQEEDGRVFITLQHVSGHVVNWNIVLRNYRYFQQRNMRTVWSGNVVLNFNQCSLAEIENQRGQIDTLKVLTVGRGLKAWGILLLFYLNVNDCESVSLFPVWVLLSGLYNQVRWWSLSKACMLTGYHPFHGYKPPPGYDLFPWVSTSPRGSFSSPINFSHGYHLFP